MNEREVLRNRVVRCTRVDDCLSVSCAVRKGAVAIKSHRLCLRKGGVLRHVPPEREYSSNRLSLG